MREIKYRGRTDGGLWLTGDLVHRNSGLAIRPVDDYGSPFGYKVQEETVGEYTGFKDGEGQEIYEGNTLSRQDESEEEKKVVWDEEGGCWALTRRGKYEDWLTEETAKDYVAVLDNEWRTSK